MLSLPLLSPIVDVAVTVSSSLSCLQRCSLDIDSKMSSLHAEGLSRTALRKYTYTKWGRQVWHIDFQVSAISWCSHLHAIPSPWVRTGTVTCFWWVEYSQGDEPSLLQLLYILSESVLLADLFYFRDCPCWLDEVNGHAGKAYMKETEQPLRIAGGLLALKATFSQHPARSWGPQSYNHKEIYSVNN